MLGAVAFSPEQLEIELDWIDEHIGGKPYGVDLLVPAKYIGVEEGGLDADQARRHDPRGAPGASSTGSSRSTACRPSPPRRSQLRPGRRPPRRGRTRAPSRCSTSPSPAPASASIANALGPAPDFMVEGGHDADKVVAGLVGKKQHAERQVQAGVDIIVAQGYEAGGHTGEVGDDGAGPRGGRRRRADTPVLAAGGIATGRQIAAAMALGAQGVWCGSVWLTTEEAETHPVVKEKFLAATSSDTVRSRASTGKPARQLRTAWTDEWADPANPDPLPMPLHGMLIAEAQGRIARAAATQPRRQGPRELLRRPGRRADEPGQAGRPGRAGHGRGVHRGRRAHQRPRRHR